MISPGPGPSVKLYIRPSEDSSSVVAFLGTSETSKVCDVASLHASAFATDPEVFQAWTELLRRWYERHLARLTGMRAHAIREAEPPTGPGTIILGR
jgi:hypothetical protein